MSSRPLRRHPAVVALFIHGGAWIGGSKTEYCRPLFNEFLSRGCLVASAEYRLLPESSFVSGQLEDIRDLEPWLRQQLPRLLEKDGSTTIQVKDVIVIGASAGAHLALLTVCHGDLFDFSISIDKAALKFLLAKTLAPNTRRDPLDLRPDESSPDSTSNYWASCYVRDFFQNQ